MDNKVVHYHAIARTERGGSFVIKDFVSWAHLLSWLMEEGQNYYNVFIQQKEE